MREKLLRRQLTALIHYKAFITWMLMRSATIECAVIGKHKTDKLAFC